MKNKLLVVALLWLTGACHNRALTEQEFLRWLTDPANGLVQTRRVNGLELTVKHLPAAYLAYRDLKSTFGGDERKRDSLLAAHGNNLVFLLTIRPETPGQGRGDVMYQGVRSYPEYKQRVMEMNFNVGEYVTLRTPAGDFAPVLHTLENTYSATEGRTLYLVFADNERQRGLLSASEWDLVFADESLETGIHHFPFERSAVASIPLVRN